MYLMKNNIKGEKVKLWTRQDIRSLDELKENGVIRISQTHLREKFGDISDYILQLYNWFNEEADKIKHLISHPVYTKNPPNGLFDQNDLRHTHRDACFLLQKSKAFKEMAASYENHSLS